MATYPHCRECGNDLTTQEEVEQELCEDCQKQEVIENMDYTKGEWKVRERGEFSNSLFSHSITVNELVIARVEGEANANLMSAAPGLYEALRNLVDRDLIADKDGDHYDEVLQALDKAEGKCRP
jgi:hypothetical protein